MAVAGGFRAQFAAKAKGVMAGSPSTSHWQGVEGLVTEFLGVDQNIVYASTISKPGNVSVRFDQSKSARRGKYLLGMYTGDLAELEGAVEPMRKLAEERDGVAALAACESTDWEIVAIAARRGSAEAAALIGEFPGAVQIGF
jgi:hypothetical protein